MRFKYFVLNGKFDTNEDDIMTCMEMAGSTKDEFSSSLEYPETGEHILR